MAYIYYKYKQNLVIYIMPTTISAGVDNHPCFSTSNRLKVVTKNEHVEVNM